MQISLKDWINFKDKMAQVSQTAADKLAEYVEKNGGYENVNIDDVIGYATAIAQKYGEASGTLAAMMYDAIAELSGARVPPAEVAPTPTYGEVAKTIRGAAKTSIEAAFLGAAIGRLVKQTGADTTLQNARRDHAQVAWIAFGDTCAYCIMQAAKGWIYVPEDALEDGHAKHIHGNCDCTYSVRFDNDTNITGYNSDRFKSMYQKAEGNTQEEKLNAMRREFYAENSEEINAQERSAYEKRKEREESWTEELNI